jgi:hypothetical protein
LPPPPPAPPPPPTQLASKVQGYSYAFVRCQEQVKIKINASTAFRARAVRLNTFLLKAESSFLPRKKVLLLFTMKGNFTKFQKVALEK